jgi:hypothetical protein
MLRQLRCLAGHSWETEDDTVGYCPRCGELADSLSLLEETPPPPETPADRVDQPTRDARGWPVVPGYELREKLPNGPFGVERYRARQLVADRLVILELVVAKDDPGQTAWGALRGEARALGKLDHPNIAPLLAVGERERLLFYNVLPDDSGPTLAEWFAGQPLPWREVVALGRVLALALQHAHERGVVHRALQPRFIRLCPAEGEGPGCVQLRGKWYRPRLEKFGLARTKIIEREPTDLEAQPEIPAYLSPEQALGHSRDIGPRSDIYALGILLAELLLGKSPLAAPTRMQTLDNVMQPFPILEPLRSRLPADPHAVLVTATSYRAEWRYESAGAFAEDLENARSGRPLRSRPAGPFRRLVKALVAFPLLWAFLLGGGIVFVLLLLGRMAQPNHNAVILLRSLRDAEESARTREIKHQREIAKLESRTSLAALGRLVEAGNLDAARELLARIEESDLPSGWESAYYARRLCGLKPRPIEFGPDVQPTALLRWESGNPDAELAIGLAVRTPGKQETGRLELWSGDPRRQRGQEAFDWPVVALTRNGTYSGGDALGVLTSSTEKQASQLHVRRLGDSKCRTLGGILRPARTGIVLRGGSTFHFLKDTITTDHKSGFWLGVDLIGMPPFQGPTGLLATPPDNPDDFCFIANNATRTIRRWKIEREEPNRPDNEDPQPRARDAFIRFGKVDEQIPIGSLEVVTTLAAANGRQSGGWGDIWLAAGGSTGAVRLWTIGNRVESRDQWKVGSHPITSLAFTPSGDRLAVGTEDGRLALYDTEQGLELVNTSLGEGAVTGLAFDRDGRKLAVIHGKRVLLWE